MAAVTNSTDKERARFGGAVSPDIPGYNGAKATDRDGRQQRRAIKVCQTREICHEIEVCPGLTIQLSYTGCQRYFAHDYKAISSWSCKCLLQLNLYIIYICIIYISRVN